MTVLVTGGAGYIGSQTVRALLDRGGRVVVVDREAAPSGAPIGDASFIQGDIADQDLVHEVLREHGVEGVIHFAALKSVAESMHDPLLYFGNNVAGSIALLGAMERAGVKRIVFSSSCAVYGNPDALPITEAAPLRPESPYGWSKVAVEEMLDWLARIHGLRSVSLRYFNAAGASPDGTMGEDWDRSTMLIPAMMRALCSVGGPLTVFGTDYPTRDGTAIRDYVHVVDLADAHILALDYLDRKPGAHALNLGTGRGHTVREVLEMARRVTGREVPFVPAPRRAGDPVAIWADSGRARDELGWTPRYGLEEIVETAWRWHRRDR